MSLPSHLATGHAILDAQHAELYDRVEDLREALEDGFQAEDLKSLLGFFHDYTIEHFRLEETIMRSLHYPRFDHQKMEHEAFWRTVLGLQMACEDAGYSSECGWKVYQTITEWMKKHLDEEDRALAEWLKARLAPPEPLGL